MAVARTFNNEILANGLKNNYNLNKKEMAFFIDKLTMDAKEFLHKNFNLDLNIPIKICNRVKNRYGGFYHTKDGMPIKIVISGKQIKLSMMDANGYEVIQGMLFHELVHYALCTLGKDYDDGSYDFEMTLANLNVPSSGVTNENRVYSTKNLSYYKLVHYNTWESYDLLKVTIANKITE